MRPEVICLPGAVAPAAQRYAPLIELIGQQAQLHLKDLEVYRDAAPPTDYSVDIELAAVDRFAQELGLATFHVLAYSAGGFVSLAYAGTRPDRLKSLAVFEPASIPGQLSQEEKSAWEKLEAGLRGLEGPAFMEAFVRGQLRPGVTLPPHHPPQARPRLRCASVRRASPR